MLKFRIIKNINANYMGNDIFNKTIISLENEILSDKFKQLIIYKNLNVKSKIGLLLTTKDKSESVYTLSNRPVISTRHIKGVTKKPIVQYVTTPIVFNPDNLVLVEEVEYPPNPDLDNFNLININREGIDTNSQVLFETIDIVIEVNPPIRNLNVLSLLEAIDPINLSNFVLNMNNHYNINTLKLNSLNEFIDNTK